MHRHTRGERAICGMSADCGAVFSADPGFMSENNAVKTVYLVHVCVCVPIHRSVPVYGCVCVDLGLSLSIALDLLCSFLFCVCVHMLECMHVHVEIRRRLSGIGSSAVYVLGIRLRPSGLAAGFFAG